MWQGPRRSGLTSEQLEQGRKAAHQRGDKGALRATSVPETHLCLQETHPQSPQRSWDWAGSRLFGENSSRKPERPWGSGPCTQPGGQSPESQSSELRDFPRCCHLKSLSPGPQLQSRSGKSCTMPACRPQHSGDDLDAKAQTTPDP